MELLKKIFKRGCLKRLVINIGNFILANLFVAMIIIAHYIVEVMPMKIMFYLAPIFILGLGLFTGYIVKNLIDGE